MATTGKVGPLFEHTELVSEEYLEGVTALGRTLGRRPPTSCQGNRFKVELEGTFYGRALLEVAYKLRSTKSHVLRRAMQVGLPPRSIMGSNLPIGAIKISLPS